MIYNGHWRVFSEVVRFFFVSHLGLKQNTGRKANRHITCDDDALVIIHPFHEEHGGHQLRTDAKTDLFLDQTRAKDTAANVTVRKVHLSIKCIGSNVAKQVRSQ